MEIECHHTLTGHRAHCWEQLLRQSGLTPDSDTQYTVLLWEGERLLATGSRKGSLLKCIAVDAQHQGEGLTATVLTHLRQDAFAAGYRHLFLYTKPANRSMFASLFFYPVAQTGDVLLMEDRRDGISSFLRALPMPCTSGEIGAAVMHCNPFTRGHRYLAEQAAAACDWVYLFILSEDAGPFPPQDRLELVRRGTADLPNVTVLPSGPYLISSATFPTYFLKDRDSAPAIHCQLDVEIFRRWFLPHFGITCRYVGTEPLSALTADYNRILRQSLPIPLRELPRLEGPDGPISASAVRALLGRGQPEALRTLVPESTLQYLEEHNLIYGGKQQ